MSRLCLTCLTFSTAATCCNRPTASCQVVEAGQCWSEWERIAERLLGGEAEREGAEERAERTAA